ncbi:MAG TPA: hypothetical protein VK943_12365 [Arenibaculum sp.]|nr:hypothetical protein [Arenibaculum sp.]
MTTYLVEAEVEVETEAGTAEAAGGYGFPPGGMAGGIVDGIAAWRPVRSIDISYRKVLPAGRRVVTTFCVLTVRADTIAEAHATAERLLAGLRTRDGDHVARACVSRVRPVEQAPACAAGDPAKPRPVGRF